MQWEETEQMRVQSCSKSEEVKEGREGERRERGREVGEEERKEGAHTLSHTTTRVLLVYSTIH